MTSLSRVTLGAVVVLVVLTAGCYGAQSASNPARSPAENSTISVGASAEVSAPPDRALVRVAVLATGPDADSVRSQVAENVSRMRSALRELGIEDDQVQTTSFHLSAIRDRTQEGQEIIGYRAEHSFEIEAGVDQAGSVIDTAVTNGANQVDGVQFTLTEETRQGLRQEALDLAVRKARSDAEVIADASGLTIVGTQSVSTGEVGFHPFDRQVGLGGGGGGTEVEPGPVSVSATVSVTYRADSTE